MADRNLERAAVVINMDVAEAWVTNESDSQPNFDDELIIMAHNHPCLWNKGTQDYRNKAKRDAVWRTISIQVGRTGKIAYKIMSILI